MLTKHFVLTVCICCLFLAFHNSPSKAQEAFEAPLLINISGQLYRWSPGEAEPTLTDCDLQGNELHRRFYSLSQSPDGIWAAFMVLPIGMGDGAPTPTGNLWVCNLELGAAYALSDADPFIPALVSNGVFSPDGHQIAWAEANDLIASTDAKILVHDLANQTTTEIVAHTPFDSPCGVGVGAPRLIWGDAGIAVGYFKASESDCGIADDAGFIVYSANGMHSMQYPVGYMGFNIFEWVEIDGEPHLAYFDDINTHQMYSININADAEVEQDGILDAFVADGEGQDGHYLLSNHWDPQNPPLIYLPDINIPLESPMDVALSPDGSLMVLVVGKTLYLAENGNLEPAPWNDEFYRINQSNGGIDFPEIKTGQLEVAWTPPRYRLVSASTAQSVCPTVEQLSLDFDARLVEGLGDNNLRSAPWASSEIVGSIPEGADFTVIDSRNFSPFLFPPVEVCSGGIRWREVIYDGVHGWTAEAQGDVYFVESGG